MFELDQIGNELSPYEDKLKDMGKLLGVEEAKEKIAELEEISADPEFWNDMAKSQKTMQTIKGLKDKVNGYENLVSKYEDIYTLIEMGQEEEDAEILEEVKQESEEFKENYEKLRIATLLDGEYDRNNAIVTLHAGEGGTEACDWVSMLYRMYTRWANKKGFSLETLDYLDGDEAGIKSVTLRISGPHAFGFLKSERGIHRLIRISPFDASGRRHTSFASVDVMPDVGDDIQLDIKETDLRFDTFRSSGPGGQSVNTTSSAVRVTHIPTGISAQCQNEKSQHHNKESALRILKARLYNLELQKREAERAAQYAGKDAIAFGSQIRTYTLQPYRLVKDHRTNSECGDVEAVLDGQIDQFQHDYLLYRHEQQR